MKRLTLVCPDSALAVPAHRLATTEQSLVMSCTRSIFLSGIIVGWIPSEGWFSALRPSTDNTSEGLRQPSKISNCSRPNRNSVGSVNKSGPANSSAEGHSCHGGNTNPFNFESCSSIICSRVDSIRVDSGCFSSFLGASSTTPVPLFHSPGVSDGHSSELLIRSA